MPPSQPAIRVDDDTRAKKMRLDWGELVVASWLAGRRAGRKLQGPRYESELVQQVQVLDRGAACLRIGESLCCLHCAVHTPCIQAHYSEPPLCDCDAGSKATPTCDNTTQQRKRLTRRIRRRFICAAFRICASLGAHSDDSVIDADRRLSGLLTTGQAHCLPTASGARVQGVA